MDNTIENFNKYSLYALLLLCFLPFIYFLLPKTFTSYFDVFDKLSIPLWAALYSFYWLKFNRKIKKTERQIPVYKNRVTALEKIHNQEYLNEYKSNAAELSKLETDIIELKRHFDFINDTLRISVIIGAAIKIVQFIFSIIK